MEALPGNKIFETDRLVVRLYEPQEFDLFYQVGGNETVMRYIRPVEPREQALNFFQKIIADYAERPGLGRWALCTKGNNRFIGSFAIIPVENSNRLQLGYALLPEEWGKGYASEATKAGLDYAFGQLGLAEIAGITYAANIPSQKVLLKNGFVLEENFIEKENEMHLYLCKAPVINA